MVTKQKLNNLHVAALYLYRNGPSKAADVRRAMFEYRNGRPMTRDDRGWYCVYFANNNPYLNSRYSSELSKHQLWYKVDDTWQLTLKGLQKALEAFCIVSPVEYDRTMATKQMIKEIAEFVAMVAYNGFEEEFIRLPDGHETDIHDHVARGSQILGLRSLPEEGAEEETLAKFVGMKDILEKSGVMVVHDEEGSGFIPIDEYLSNLQAEIHKLQHGSYGTV